MEATFLDRTGPCMNRGVLSQRDPARRSLHISLVPPPKRIRLKEGARPVKVAPYSLPAA